MTRMPSWIGEASAMRSGHNPARESVKRLTEQLMLRRGPRRTIRVNRETDGAAVAAEMSSGDIEGLRRVLELNIRLQ